MANPDLSRRSLDTLPYDILLHILHCYGQNESVPKRYRLLFALSQVNHCLRFFALPLLAQEVAIPRWQNYLEAVKHFTGPYVKSGLLRAGSVRHIYIGHMSDSRCLRIDLARKLNEVPFPFHNLRSFSCGACVFRPYELQFLEGAFRLTSLSIRWNNEWNFPDISDWPELCTLRLTVSGYDDICWSPPCEYRSFSSLTTLVMYELPGSYCSWWNHQSDNYTFPNLRVFRISRARNPPSVYHFVQRHPTLLEVNVRCMVTSRHLPYCKLSRLIKLIDGTGTWRVPPKELSPVNSYAHSFIPDHSILVDVPEYDEDTMTALGEELFMTCSAFAFKRIPLYSEATQWDKPFGSPEPRFTAIEFAFQGQWWCEEQGVPMVRLHEFLEKMPHRFPQLEVLRLSTSAFYRYGNVADIWANIGIALRKWPHLRKLAVNWGSTQLYKNYWNSEQEVVPGLNVPILDDVVPPVHYDYGEVKSKGELARLPPYGHPFRLSELKGWDLYNIGEPEIEAAKQELQAMIGNDFNIHDDEDDQHLLIRAWETRHAPRVAAAMRRLAECCPTLEEIEWYPAASCMSDDPLLLRWLWKIHRRKYSHAVRMVSGTFTYAGCPNGDPPPFLYLVGQELDQAMLERSRAI